MGRERHFANRVGQLDFLPRAWCFVSLLQSSSSLETLTNFTTATNEESECKVNPISNVSVHGFRWDGISLGGVGFG